jgi:hypothetical protein
LVSGSELLHVAVSPSVVAALIMMGLAAWLLVLDFNRTVYRVFALFLFLRALVLIANALQRLPSADSQMVALLGRLLPYYTLPLIPLVAYFALIFPRPRTPLGRSRWLAPMMIGLVALLLLLYATDHARLWEVTWEPGELGPYSAEAGGRYYYADYGPLVLLVALLYPSFALLALVFALDYAHTPAGARRRSHLLVAAGFALNALFDGTVQALSAWQLVQSGEAYPWLPWGWTRPVLANLTLPLALVAVGLVGRHAFDRRQPSAERVHARRLLYVAPLPIFSAALLVGGGSEILRSQTSLFVLGLWRLALPLLVTYALLRYQLFDISVKVRWTLAKGAVAVPFLATFFVVAQLGENFLNETLGVVGGGVAAGLLLFAFNPIQRFAEGLAEKAMPGTKSLDDMSRAQRRAFYREQLQLAWQDGTINRKERLMLEALRKRLGLTHDDAASLETGVMRETG